jgi:alcohol dehydrogenase
VAASAGIDAISHAVETAASTKRNQQSRELSAQAWRLLEGAYEPAVHDGANVDVRLRMQVGAYLAGAAIERSMLGAAHACANPLTARFQIPHGQAVGMMLPHVVRFNVDRVPGAYADLCEDAESLAVRIEALLDRGSLPRRLVDCGVSPAALSELAAEASKQWTARFNPTPVDEKQLLQIYQLAST